MEKIAFIDVEGTLTDFEFWNEIANYVENGDEIRALLHLGLTGKINWLQGFLMRIDLIRGLEISTVKKVSEKFKLKNRTIKTISYLKQDGFKIILISGMFKEVIGKELSKSKADIISNNLIVKNGIVVGANLNFIDKGSVVKRYRRQNVFVLAVGDGANDLPMFRWADIKICVGGNPVLRREADFCINDFTEIINVI
ncbi:HAD family hydrolase [Thermococcus barophilus]|uniref:phosphoserine phosphatase n=1 Tax=Thermococcus barophilus (strain DSM 11836 / MP) TaxID=391623 RepID=F0LJE1_THEBM|nr:HAD family phosphatase [Thermococcus barophilus]ADT83407.1 phosphoserine phosphatase [Thermococcus barophilus MP]